ncbi:thiamine pyrophosphate binding domain-containing protein [Novosphingobium sp. Rr 2-17]|uniref:alpha-keto acid decarboxylase family protein n=1 Tax=Novosphingobium sp. Rr 2-17 TaxID=555793 RepID=UPI000269A870|nr:thiamine pyrophosphate-dependent enzyme [Novosphingobium sp. Rr 2-17]EIZ77908.1 thiamine pyrophosphate binding domain-containing protein [Novosphingobium sp. Rr 2-17]
MDHETTVGQYLVDRLSEIGLRHLFSIAGDYSIEWLNRYVTPSKIALIEEVNELNAGYAADAYARMRGIGALCTTYSAGSLCAVNPVAGAYVEKVPLVLIAGTPSIKRTLTFEQTGFCAHHFIAGRQTDLQVFQYITVATIRLDDPDAAPGLIDYALRACISQKRPVYIELLQDIVDLPCPAAQDCLTRSRMLCSEPDLGDAIKAIAPKLAAASKPLLWLGVEINRFGLSGLALQLVEHFQIPFVTELMSKSVLSEDHPLFAGVFDGQSSSGQVQSLMAQADVVLALGIWLTDINDLGGGVDTAKTVFASFDTVKHGPDFWAQVTLDRFIKALLTVERPSASGSFTRIETAPDIEANPCAAITYDGFYDILPDYIDAHTIVSCDASLNYFGAIRLKVPGPGNFFAQTSYSAIGYAGPAATGLCLAREDGGKVLVLSGDGGFQMTAQCLSTQTRFGLDPIIFIMDNGSYAVEQWLANAAYFATDKPFYESCRLHRWDYAQLAGVFGCRGWRVQTRDELRKAVADAMSNKDSPSIIQVMLPDKDLPANARWKIAIDAQTAPP